jgi:arylsulfatase A-like enzyme
MLDLDDPMVVAVDGQAPSNEMDGLRSSLFLGDGWGKPEGTGAADEWGSMAWIVGREAFIHVALPPGPPMDFYGFCIPFPWTPGSPVQTVELLSGDRVIGRSDLFQGWGQVRIPLPDDLPRERLLDLRLRFAHALKPPENDSRSLAAAFTLLAAVPRTVPDPRSFLAAHSFDPQTRRVVLPAGGGLRLPVPPASRVRVRLADLLSRCPGCRLSLELTSPGDEEPRILLAEKRVDASEVEASFDTGPRGIQHLWVRVSGPQGGPSRGSLEFRLAEVGLERQRRARGVSGTPNVFVYMIDTLRADEVGPYGGRPPLTPRMNAFAGEAVTYLQARAPSSWTLPSVVSLLTGQYPDRHGVMEGSRQFDAEHTPSLQQLLGQRGYRTAGISQSFIIGPTYGMHAGFKGFYIYDNLNGRLLRSQEARSLLLAWLGQATDDAPVFAYLHTVDPHAPYSPPAGFRGAAEVIDRLPLQDEGLPQALVLAGRSGDPAEVAHLRALYEGEVRYADQELGRFVDLLKWLGVYDDSFVIVAGDHGEEFAEHGAFEHGTTLFEEVLRVPLLVKYPGGRWAGERIDRPVSLVDVAPTVMAGIAGKDSGKSFDGRTLPGPEGPSRREPVYFEVRPYRDPGAVRVDLRGLVAEGVKCLENRAGVDDAGRPAPRFVTYDLAKDPAEQNPLPVAAGESARCRALLEGWSRSRERVVRQERTHRGVSPEAIERLRAIGYVH